MPLASSGVMRPGGGGRGTFEPTLSIHWPEESSPYVRGLFAFHIARPSVVIAQQPTSSLLRISHGATTTPAPTSTSPQTSALARARGQAKREIHRAENRHEDEPAVPEQREARHDAEERGEPSRGPLGDHERQEDERRRAHLVDDLAVDMDVVPDEIRVERRNRRADESRPAARSRAGRSRTRARR